MPTIATKRTQPHSFVPDDLDATDPQAVSALYDKLEERDVSTREQLQEFIHDAEELAAAIYDAYSRAYVDMTVDTTNPDHEAKYLKIVEELVPISEQRDFQLKRKMLLSSAARELDGVYEVFLRNIRSEVEIFREENVHLITEEIKLSQEHEKILGCQETPFRGETRTMPQLALFLEEPERATREEAWRARGETWLADAGKMDELFDRMYRVRHQIALNAGFDNYRDYKFKQLKRFDYTPEDCMDFHAAIEKHIVPLLAEDWERHREMLGVETLRPWDAGVRPGDPIVDPEGHAPLRPFESVARLLKGCERITEKVDPELGGYLRQMREDRLLDLDNRPGKAPGGYMTSFPDVLAPFIFMNAVGTKRDVDTMLHEGGHAFHYFLARKQPLYSYHHTGQEFSEVASQAMELLARPYLDEFYSGDDLARILDDQVLTVLRFFPWMAMLDAFQHWVYTSPEHDSEARRAKWIELEGRFRPYIDWSGLEAYREIGWQYPHVFDVPFYYVEYGIAQLGALQIWLNSLEDERGAVEAYKRALSLGGSRPLPELFAAAGAEFAFDDGAVGSLVGKLKGQLGR